MTPGAQTLAGLPGPVDRNAVDPVIPGFIGLVTNWAAVKMILRARRLVRPGPWVDKVVRARRGVAQLAESRNGMLPTVEFDDSSRATPNSTGDLEFGNPFGNPLGVTGPISSDQPDGEP